VQNDEVRGALQYYTINGQMKMLDATEDSLKAGHLQTFEMGWLLAQKPDVYLPVLMYIFNEIEARLDAARGKNPTLIILEEAWLYIGHEVFAAKIKDWLKTLRKKNARVIFATQSPSDIYDPQTKALLPVTAAILDACPTRVYLPNASLDKEGAELYKKLGLNDRQLEIIKKEAIAKRHYYVVTPEGKRLIDLGFSDVKPLALAFIGLSTDNGQLLVECKQKYGEKWVFHWLIEQGFPEWAYYWQANYADDLQKRVA
jgi:type IV secretion system protein VirB4